MKKLWLDYELFSEGCAVLFKVKEQNEEFMGKETCLKFFAHVDDKVVEIISLDHAEIEDRRLNKMVYVYLKGVSAEGLDYSAIMCNSPESAQELVKLIDRAILVWAHEWNATDERKIEVTVEGKNKIVTEVV